MDSCLPNINIFTMARLIQLTRPDNNKVGHESTYVTINTGRILMVEDHHGREEGESVVFLENGKKLIVMESQDEIRDLANQGGGIGGIL